MINTNFIDTRVVCKVKNGYLDECDVLILGTTLYGVSFVYISSSDIYNDIDDAKVHLLDGDQHICFDRVTYLSWTDFKKIHVHSYERLTCGDFNRVLYSIQQFYMGSIIWNKYMTKFTYKDEYAEVKKSLKVITSKSIQENEYPKHPANIEPADDSQTDILDFEDLETVSDEVYDEIDVPDEITDTELSSIVGIAKEFDIPVKIDHNEETNEEEVKFDLIVHRKSENAIIGLSASEPRYRDKYSKTLFSKRWFTKSEVETIARMTSSSVASEYNCSVEIATNMIRNAKRILNIAVASHVVTNRFSCYFNEGMTVEQVCHLYPKLGRKKIEREYTQWQLNGNIDGNKETYDKWNKIFEEMNYDAMIDRVFDTHNSFAATEGCTVVAARNIIHKMYDILASNPFICAGFKREAFNPNEIWKLAMDIELMRKPSIADRVTHELYVITSRLEKLYRESYNDHYKIKAGLMDIPDGVSLADRDYFMSLIWNRFSRNSAVPNNRVLTQNQIDAINSGDWFKVSLYFMVPYNRAGGIIAKYKKNKDKQEGF